MGERSAPPMFDGLIRWPSTRFRGGVPPSPSWDLFSVDDHMAFEGKLVRTAEGQYIEGTSGNPRGRPKGSKNRITLLKMQTEEAWRERNAERLDTVLDMILQDALDGDKGARKMIFDAVVSKANVAEDKAAGQKQTITVHRMEVKQGDKSTKPMNDEDESNV